jgi:UDP-glucose 4-epimerase
MKERGNMTTLVTGGSGFIGSRNVRDLVRDGESVVVYDWQPDIKALQRVISDEQIASRVKIVQGDVANFALLFRILKENNITRIVHMAGLLIHDVIANPLQGVKVNCEGTTNVFEAARLLEIKKVVWPSSGSVYGPPAMYSQEYIPNDAPHFPQNLYGATKSLDEMIAAHYIDRYGLDITGLRFVMVYGFGQSRGRTAAIVRELICNPALGKPGKVPAAGDNVLGWTYVEDAAAAVNLALKAVRPPTRTYSVRGEIRLVKEMAGYVKEYFPRAEINLLDLDRSASHTIMTCKYDMTLIEKELGFHSRWTARDGVRDTINDVLKEAGLPAVSQN